MECFLVTPREGATQNNTCPSFAPPDPPEIEVEDSVEVYATTDKR